MKIAVSAQGKTAESPVDTRFGRAACFMVYDDVSQSWEAVDNRQNLEAAQGAGIQAAANVVNAGCSVLISGHCGPKAFAALSRGNVEVYMAEGGNVNDVFAAWRNGSLKRMENADVEGHW